MRRSRLFTLVRNALGATALAGATVLACMGPATAAPLTPGQVNSPAFTYCNPGYVCAFDSHDSGGAVLWTSSACGSGTFNLGSMGLGDRVSSIYNNRGSGSVQALNWGASAGWLNVGGVIGPNRAWNYFGAEDNIIDGLHIGC